ncbi:MAG TPA: M3 family metallopeptidase, partial [Brumimicrobium sp.]|nr:M3 family metallopeptidase [Brumimicrobium sp.]
MKRTAVFSLFITMGLLSSCGSSEESNNTTENKNNLMDNPFVEESTLDFQVPDFTKIKNEHFRPALEEGMNIQLEEIEAIANNEEDPTFENTLVALEKTGSVLKRTSRVFYLLAGAETNDEIREIQQEMAPKFAALSDAIYLNTNLFNRVKAIKEQLPELDLDLESERLVTYYYEQFVSAGAELSEADKDLLKTYNEELASLTTKFSNLSMEAMKGGSFITDNVDDLEGLSESAIATAAEAATTAGHEGKWLIPLMNTTQQPVLASLKNSDIRKVILNNSFERAQKGGENDTRELTVKIAQLRAKRANLLGFDSYAHWNLNNQMVKSPETVDKFFAQLVPAAVQRVKEEENELLALVKEDNPTATKVEPWDWNYYSEQLRRAKYDLDEEEIKPYFELYNVLENGVFFAVNKLYGLTFTERTDLPVYHEDVKVYDVFDHDGSQIGIFYSDNFARPTKRGGAWMSNLVGQSHLLGTSPVIYNVCNFTKPAEGQPALLTWDD